MTKKYFYHEHVVLRPLHEHFDEVSMPDEHRHELLEIVHKTIHLEVINYVLNNLPQDHHEEFIKHVEEKPHDKGISIFLKQSIEHLETNLGRVIKSVISDFIHEVNDYKNTTKEWYSKF